MPALAVTPVDILEVIGLGAAGFVVVALVCAGVLAMLQLILPSADSGATALDARSADDVAEAGPVDTEGNA